MATAMMNRRNVAETVAHQNPDADRAQHQELAVREIDDPGQSEDQRDANPHEDDDARHGEAVYELLKKGDHTSLLGQRRGFPSPLANDPQTKVQQTRVEPIRLSFRRRGQPTSSAETFPCRLSPKE